MLRKTMRVIKYLIDIMGDLRLVDWACEDGA
jgi:hypothetical protein